VRVPPRVVCRFRGHLWFFVTSLDPGREYYVCTRCDAKHWGREFP
jgi:predicted RNA-binding protein YlxR (DUF448 family)